MKQYIVDAFTNKLFSGNQAAVCVLDTWLPDELMLKITIENNFSETAFTVKERENYHLRWFTPGGEINLCGHATLATAFVLMNFVDKSLTEVAFTTLSGILTVRKQDELLTLDFPTVAMQQIPVTDVMEKAIGVRPLEAYLGEDLVCVLPNEAAVRNAKPQQDIISKLDGLLLHITAKGKDYDCVSRSFAPKCGIAEDPVCGRCHCHIIKLWSEKLHKNKINAFQASARTGELYCEYAGKHTLISGKAVLFAQSEINL